MRVAASGAPGVVKAAGRHRQRHALATAYVGMWGDLESAGGVWVTDVHAQVTRATPATGKAVSAAEAEAWCAKALPKQDKQTRFARTANVGVRRLDDGTGNFPPP